MKEISKSGEGPAFGANARQCIYTACPCYSQLSDIKYKKSKKCLSSEKNYDPYDAEEYDNADDFAEEFGDGDYDEGYDDAYDYWEERDQVKMENEQIVIELKELLYMEFRRYLYRRKANVTAQSILLAIGYNINKLHYKIQAGRTGRHLFPLKQTA